MRRKKHQDPNTKLQRNTKIQAPSVGGASGQVWEARSRAWWEKPGSEPMVLLEEPERHPFDLEERTAVFGEEIVRFTKKIPLHPTNERLIDQLVGCGTSVGANYCEANEGVSRKDFRHPISRCVKEAKETKYFLRMVVASEPQLADQARKLYREANELLLIFASMYRK